jgi:hypothetical protein
MKRLDNQIELKRAEVRALQADLDKARAELHFLFARQAQRLCPIELGTIIQYAPGKFGRVDRIGFHLDLGTELVPKMLVSWTVAGRKFNQDKQLGKLDFHPVGPATHEVRGTFFRKKSAKVEWVDPHLPLIFDLATRKRVS